MLHAAHYFDRAAWAFHNATHDKLPLKVKNHLAAMALHACQSLKESLDQAAQDNPANIEIANAIKKLPNTELIENVRNMDLHGWPLPVCDPKVQMVSMVSKPGKPITLSSSHGVPLAMTMPGVAPRVHNPNRQFANVKFGGATVSFGCIQGKLVVHDFSTNKDYVLLEVIRAFLGACHAIIKNRIPEPSGQTDTKPPSAS